MRVKSKRPLNTIKQSSKLPLASPKIVTKTTAPQQSKELQAFSFDEATVDEANKVVLVKENSEISSLKRKIRNFKKANQDL